MINEVERQRHNKQINYTLHIHAYDYTYTLICLASKKLSVLTISLFVLECLWIHLHLANSNCWRRLFHPCAKQHNSLDIISNSYVYLKPTKLLVK